MALARDPSAPPHATVPRVPQDANRPGEFRFRVDGRIPVLKVHFEPRPVRAVVVLHGLGASAEVQRPELEALARAGFAAVGVDAPHHGARRDAWLDDMGALRDATTHERFLRLLLEFVPEVSRVIDHLVAEGHGPVGLVGISMGAYAAFAVARADARVAATVSLLGSPDWRPVHGEVTPSLAPLLEHAPVHAPEETARAPLLLANAGRDTAVPPAAARAFAERLRGRRDVTYLEYPESEHLVRPEDWADLWRRTLAFLGQHVR